MPSLSPTNKRKSPAERVDDEDDPLKKIACPTCSIDGCKNKGIGGGICSKHGGKELFSHERGVKRVQNRGVSSSHGAMARPYVYKRCSVEGCEKHARTQGGFSVCVSHGAIVKRCNVDECNNYPQKGGLCMRHHKEIVLRIDAKGCKVNFKGNAHCSIDGCTNKGIGGGMCKKHGGKQIRKKCSVEGCDKFAYKRGVCVSHGATYERCRVEGCGKFAQKWNVCVSHGAITKRCSVDGCGNGAFKGGVCKRHKSQRRDVQPKAATDGQQREESVSSSQRMGRIEVVQNAVKLYEEECSVDECTFQAQAQGSCATYGVTCKAKQCKHRGCSTNALYYGFCMRHAPKAFCKVDGCSNIAVMKGCCTRHTMANTVSPMASNSFTLKNGMSIDKLDQVVCIPITISHEHKECMKHFAGEKQIPAHQSNHDGCDKRSQQGGVCSVDKCKNKSALGGICMKHGGNRSPRCSVDECKNKSRLGGICMKHGGKRAPRPKKLCSTAECTNYAIKGGVCAAHGAGRKRCSVESCGSRSQIGGLCFSHCSKHKLKRCSVDGCSTRANRLGLCFKHGPKTPCSYKGCDSIAQRRGYCRRHAKGNLCSKESNSSTLKNDESDQVVCISIDYEHEDKIRNIRPADYTGLPDPPIMSSDDTSLIGSKQKTSPHLAGEQVYKPNSYTKQAKITTLDSDEDFDEEEELGALIYRFSRTAKMRAEQAQSQKGSANREMHKSRLA